MMVAVNGEPVGSLAGLLWSDEPAKTDLLDAKAIAETVADALLDDDLDPLSLGLSGPWGSGKTTVLELVDQELQDRSSDDSKVLVVRSDPWRYDPSVGAKESIIADILDRISKELTTRPPSTSDRARDLIKRLGQRVDWAKGLRMAATTALTLQLPGIDSLADLVKDPSPSEGDKAGPRGLAGFHAEFRELVDTEELSHVQRVVVLVDDLDRCLSRTVVETLEAVRLFLSVAGMAFVIAADEDRVSDAIRAELPEWEMPKDRPASRDALPSEPPWKLYLHKIVQTTVPLPALGAFDTESYLLLLQVQNRTKDKFTDDQLNELIAECRRLRGVGALDSLRAPNNCDVHHELAFAHRLTSILYEKFAGNPRRIKRFLNDMNVRRSIAVRRGIELEPDVVAKLMALEVLLPEQFTEVLSWLRTGQLRENLGALEALAEGKTHGAEAEAGAPVATATVGGQPPEPIDDSDEPHPTSDRNFDQEIDPAQHGSLGREGTRSTDLHSRSHAVGEQNVPYADIHFSDDLIRWAKLEPQMVEIDLSPYLHLAASFTGDLLVSDELPQRLRDIVHQLNATGPTGKRIAETQVSRLTTEDARLLIRFFARRARDRTQEQRGAITAIGRIAAAHPSLAPTALEAFRRLPVEDLSVPSAILLRGMQLDGLDSVVEELADRSSGPVKNALIARNPMTRRG